MSSTVTKSNHSIDKNTRKVISDRYKVVTKAVNTEFYDSSSDTMHSLYVGSYGRGTAIDTSDLDIMVILPENKYERYDKYGNNGQSRLLQSVKDAVKSPYPRSDIRADGQVVKINFSDGMRFEILPAFEQAALGRTTYIYPDSNMGGNWLSTNPKVEQDAMRKKDADSNHLLVDTCRHMRYVHNTYFSSYPLHGIVIDTFIYDAIGSWHWPESDNHGKPMGSYEKALLDYWENTSAVFLTPLHAPGSNDLVEIKSSNGCLGKVLHKMADE
ncbi:SMODS domain-containing nucleotidyltransferase [Bifidobacterium favimelis]|uniref:Nucleotidyltransferase domain-containing protein n=1 Tax=Bifidobacterium favimelis TaxID=3122979 RepID=A0ABU8ZNX0_9BIFI